MVNNNNNEAKKLQGIDEDEMVETGETVITSMLDAIEDEYDSITDLTTERDAETSKLLLSKGYSPILFEHNLEETPSLSGLTKHVALSIGIDSGSSSFRTGIVKQKGRFTDKDILITPNTYGDVTGQDLTRYPSKSTTLYDNLEFIITEHRVDGKPEMLFPRPKHIVAGSLLERTGVAERFQTNATKTQQEPIYVNTLIYTALNLYIRNLTRTEKIEGATVNLGYVLPPLESDPELLASFINKIKGRYTVEMPRCNFKVDIIMENVQIEGESEVPFLYYILSSPNPRETMREFGDKNCLIIDVGANSADIAFIKNGILVDFVSDTFKDGVTGNVLLQRIIKDIGTRRGGNKPREDMVFEALQTGLLTSNNSVTNIVPEIEKHKKMIGESIYNRAAKTIQNSTYSFQDFSAIFFVGRTMKETSVEGSESYVPSIAKWFMERYNSENNTNTKGIHITTTDNPNLLGLLYAMRASQKSKK